MARNCIPWITSRQPSMRSAEQPAVPLKAWSSNTKYETTSATHLETDVQLPPATVLSLPSAAPRQCSQRGRARGYGSWKLAPKPCQVPVPCFAWSPEEEATLKADEEKEAENEQPRLMQLVRAPSKGESRAPSKGESQSLGSLSLGPPASGVQQLAAHQKRKGGANRWVPPIAYPPAGTAISCKSSSRSTSSVQSEPPEYFDVMLNGGLSRTASTCTGGAVLTEDELSRLVSPRCDSGRSAEHFEEVGLRDSDGPRLAGAVQLTAAPIRQDALMEVPRHKETGLLPVRLEEAEVVPAIDPCDCLGM